LFSPTPLSLSAALLATASLAWPGIGAADVQSNGAPDLVGEHSIVDTRTGTVLLSARVEVSELGMRVSNRLDGRQVIANFALGRYWLIDRSRRLVHEVPLSITDRASPRHDEAPDANGHLAAGVFSTGPCLTSLVGESKPGRWRGRRVAIVDCLDERGILLARDYYSSDLGMVIRSVDLDGIADEFRSIERLPLDATRFLPPSHLELVDLTTFSTPAAPLQRYAGSSGPPPGTATSSPDIFR